MVKAIFGIGIPGSGKTTALKAFSEKNNYWYISPDEIRKQLTGNEGDQSQNEQVWRIAEQRLVSFLKQGGTVVFDATLIDPAQRKKITTLARQSGAKEVEGIITDVDVEIAKERNSIREKVVPEELIERWAEVQKRYPPELSEGFDALFTIDEYQHLIEARRWDEGHQEVRRSFR